MSGLPQAVQKQIDAANAAVERQANPDESARQQSAQQEQAQEQQQQQQAPSSQEQQKPDNAERENDPTYWKNRFLTLQGKYNKEVPELSQQLAQANATIDSLNKQAKSGEDAIKRYLTDDEREEYGDLGELIERVLHRSEDSRREVETSERTQTDTRNSFVTELTSLAPDWEAKNTDDGFNDWLDDIDDLTGRQRRELLIEAHQVLNAKRVAAFFNAYQGTHQAAATDEPSPLPNNGNGVNHDLGNDAPVITQGFIKQFYTDKAQGRYKGREAEAAAIEKQIFASQNGS